MVQPIYTQQTIFKYNPRKSRVLSPSNSSLSQLLNSSLSRELDVPYVTGQETFPAHESDHLPKVLYIDFAKFNCGKGMWKHNLSLLLDQEYLNQINRTIKEICAKYVKHDGFPKSL